MFKTIFKQARIATLAFFVVATLLPSFGGPASAASSATTIGASNITATTANLAGSATFTPSNEWFEITYPNGSVYSVDAHGGAGFIQALQPNTTYRVRYVAQQPGQTCFGDWVSFTTSSGAIDNPTPATCNASLTWNTSSVNAGGSATETWTITGADSATGECTGLANHPVDFGPHSYTFNNMQPGVFTCTVHAIKNGQECDSASASVTVNGAAAPTTNVHGYHDGASGSVSQAACVANGWATDPDSQSRPVTVKVYVDGSFNTSGSAYMPRSDLGGVCPGGNCAFNIPLSITGTHSVLVKGVDNETGQEVTLGSSPKTLTCGGSTTPELCTATGALNYGQPLPCQFPPTQTCQDPAATNYHIGYPCTYPPQNRCTDPNALNYNQVGACQYPTCTNPTATTGAASNVTQTSATISGTVTNTTTYFFEWGTTQALGQTTQASYPAGSAASGFLANLSPSTTYYYRVVAQSNCATVRGQILSFTTPATQVQTCTDTTANNYGGALPCTYNRCTDPNANNYNQIGSCTYNRCLDTNATNYNQIGACQYNRCLDTNATNYNQIGTCTYNRCLDPNATNYNQNGTCIYNNQRCLDPNASNYNQYGTCVYNYNRCSDPNATNYLGSLPCQYRQNFGQAPIAITDPASAIGRTSALLNGRVNPNGYNATGWFEWATSYSVVANGGGTPTYQQNIGSGYNLYNLSAPLSGLQPSTTYYFRVVGQNAYGTAYGQVLSFTTGGGGVVVTNNPPTVVTSVSGGVIGGSCLVLTPTIQPNNPLPGQEFVYGITYRNDCPFDLLSASMRIYLPNEVDFSTTNYPFLTRDLNVITYSLGTVPRNFQNTILVRGVTKTTVVPGDNLIFKSDLSFVDPQRKIETVSAFLTAIVAGAAAGAAVTTGSVLGASTFGSLMGFFSSGWFWFLLFLLLLALFILWLATRNREEELVHEH